MWNFWRKRCSAESSRRSSREKRSPARRCQKLQVEWVYRDWDCRNTDFQSVRPAEFDSAAVALESEQRTKCPLDAPARGPCSIATTGEQSARVFRKRTLRECQTM